MNDLYICLTRHMPAAVYGLISEDYLTFIILNLWYNTIVVVDVGVVVVVDVEVVVESVVDIVVMVLGDVIDSVVDIDFVELSVAISGFVVFVRLKREFDVLLKIFELELYCSSGFKVACLEEFD
jgi:hypothetical protein